jgi:hypothetical protein
MAKYEKVPAKIHARIENTGPAKVNIFVHA